VHWAGDQTRWLTEELSVDVGARSDERRAMFVSLKFPRRLTTIGPCP
jgi:hypothetical protein